VYAIDTPELRKERGAFFTPQPVAEFLVRWAVREDREATVYDPTCGDGVFLQAAARQLHALGAAFPASQVIGGDLHDSSLQVAADELAAFAGSPTLIRGDFFELPAPAEGGPVAHVHAVVGNPPFIRYQHHAGAVRLASMKAAAGQGVSLSALASSWAAALVHASAFLAPGGRLGIVLPAELLTVHYAAPIREWLQRRFASVDLVTFGGDLIFEDALARVVLLLAAGEGGCDSVGLHTVTGPAGLASLQLDGRQVVGVEGARKWTRLLLDGSERGAFDELAAAFSPLVSYGSPTLGAVTGANDFFAISEETRGGYGIGLDEVIPLCPPGTKHLAGPRFTRADWQRNRRSNERVWLLQPALAAGDLSSGMAEYLDEGVARGIPAAYKCRVRDPWWRPPAPDPPDLFFTYMSHRHPRLIANEAAATFVNSMHGLKLRDGLPEEAAAALPLLAYGSVTLLGAELVGRSYGGGILKLEPREAAALPVPAPAALSAAWERLYADRDILEAAARAGNSAAVTERVDRALFGRGHGTPLARIRSGIERLRRSRTRT
jgi:adenine-specific DNA-methyltransferase